MMLFVAELSPNATKKIAPRFMEAKWGISWKGREKGIQIGFIGDGRI